MTDAAVGVFLRTPSLRSRSTWVVERAEGDYQYTLLCMVCALEGLDLIGIPAEFLNAVIRQFLAQLGYTGRDVLAIEEINDMTHDLDILLIRLERYFTTNQRIDPRGDDLTGADQELERI